MKFLKKASLAAAIAAASISAQAGMVALDDETMAATTGQAGVTIEINIGSAGITVGEIEYIDEGSVLMQNLKVSNVTNLKQTIDVDANGNLLLGVTGVNGVQVALGDTAADTSGQFSAVALKSTAGEVTELVNNLDMTFNLGETNTKVLNMAAAGNATAIAALPTSAQTGSVAILANTTIEITDMNVGAFGYTKAQAENLAAAARAGGTIADDDAVEAGYASQLANGSAVQITGLKFYGTGGVGTGATIEQTIWAKGGSAGQNGTADQGGGVYIQLGQIAGTLEVGGIAMGGESIGSLKISDINLAGMTQRIYGH
ncbi:DUF6160 family protein [Venatoribacter cucullus]|uniref:DUF6160 family protein n=1 Tax=Venatoribacter cucullus TaxID=2661630 RepID=UPI0022406AE6|nr:DUF6160 family protein [Venatoribacter cucullus]UZK03666.1 hypothetical protein GAY96_07035 [Venatoribacter cucullus]